MTEEEKQAIRASLAGKRVSQMTKLERQVFDEDFLYGFSATPKRTRSSTSFSNTATKMSMTSKVLRRLGLSGR